jgi:hypothetical protein
LQELKNHGIADYGGANRYFEQYFMAAKCAVDLTP